MANAKAKAHLQSQRGSLAKAQQTIDQFMDECVKDHTEDECTGLWVIHNSLAKQDEEVVHEHFDDEEIIDEQTFEEVLDELLEEEEVEELESHYDEFVVPAWFHGLCGVFDNSLEDCEYEWYAFYSHCDGFWLDCKLVWFFADYEEHEIAEHADEIGDVLAKVMSHGKSKIGHKG